MLPISATVRAARFPLRRIVLTFVVGFALVMGAFPSAAGAHSLDSSTISVRVGEQDVTATISLALETLDGALDSDHADEADVDLYADEVISYLDEHLSVVGADGRAWAETYTNPISESVEGIASFSVDVTFDIGEAAPSDFTITYDAIIESVADHEAVVVLTDADDDISNPGILTLGSTSLDIGAGGGSVAIADMVEHGFDHVLEGADHLLFLMTLLLPASLVIAHRRWVRGPSPTATLRKVLHVITAFTIGHSLTLMLSALGWVSVPTRPVELLIAASVGVSAVHAIRPLVARGEEIIAFGFGLVHGLAFAGILADLGLAGSASVLALLAFNIGIELSQLVTAALVFPSLYLLSTTRWFPLFRVAGATLALAAAVGWGLERLELTENPFAPFEDAAIHNPWRVVIGLAALAISAKLIDRRDADPTPQTARVLMTFSKR